MPNFELGTRKHTTESSTCAKGSSVRPTSRAQSDVDPGLGCPAAAAAAVVAAVVAAAATSAAVADNFLFLEKIMNPNVTGTYDRLRRFSFLMVQLNPYASQI